MIWLIHLAWDGNQNVLMLSRIHKCTNHTEHRTQDLCNYELCMGSILISVQIQEKLSSLFRRLSVDQICWPSDTQTRTSFISLLLKGGWKQPKCENNEQHMCFILVHCKWPRIVSENGISKFCKNCSWLCDSPADWSRVLSWIWWGGLN